VTCAGSRSSVASRSRTTALSPSIAAATPTPTAAPSGSATTGRRDRRPRLDAPSESGRCSGFEMRYAQ
jgi:hypothetical protein